MLTASSQNPLNINGDKNQSVTIRLLVGFRIVFLQAKQN